MTGFVADDERCLVVLWTECSAVVLTIEHELFLTLKAEQRVVQVYSRDVPKVGT